MNDRRDEGFLGPAPRGVRNPLNEDWDGRPIRALGDPQPGSPEALRLDLKASQDAQGVLQRRLGQERGERERLERLVVEVTEALRPLRGVQPHPIVDVWSGAVLKAQKALDAFANEKEPAQQVEPQAMSAPAESPEEFYKRTAQELRQALEIAAMKAVDQERKSERLERLVEEQADLIRGQDERDEKHRQEMFQARLALREMAKLV